MKYFSLLSTALIFTLGLTACSDRAFFYSNEDANKPAYEQGGQQSGSADSRAPLDVPPQLMGDVEVPSPGEIATKSGRMSSADKKLIAGKAVSLDAKVYETSAAQVFSAVVDSMTALNLPVQSVDSPSGTLTTDWIRQASVEANVASSVFSGMFGGDGVQAFRYRFVVRVLRQKVEEAEVTRLEVRTIGQAYINRAWVNRQVVRKASDELFSAVDERLSN